MTVDFGPASQGIGLGIGIIGMGIGLRFMNDTVQDMKRSTKSREYRPKIYTPKHYSFKPLKWKL